jgi:hypothetical protein
MAQDKTIVFFFPSHTLGGVQTLFIRLIRRLHEDGYKLGYVDFVNGIMRKDLAHLTDIAFIDVKSINTNTIDFELDCVVVTSFNFINLVTLFFTKNTPFLFWFLSPYNLPIKNLSKKLKVKIDNLKFFKKNYLGLSNYKSALEAESVYFMDSFCFEYNGEPYTEYDPYLPLYLNFPKNTKLYNVTSTTLNIAWVGRIDLSLKYHCVVYLIQKFENLKNNPDFEDVTLTIVGDGAGGEKIRSLCQCSPFNTSIKVIKSIPYENLNSYLLDNIDIVFAHGTTCLESASLAIPTVCLDPYIYKYREDYKFKWLFSSEKYHIGKYEFGEEYSKEGMHLSEILEQVKRQRKQVSDLSLEVVREQYEQDIVLNKFLLAVDRTQVNKNQLKINFLTILLDSLVHWRPLVRKIYGSVIRGYLKSVFKL